MDLVKSRPTAKIQAPQIGRVEQLAQNREEPPDFLDIPGIDMYAENGELITKVFLPEFKDQEVKVTATSEGLEISAMRKKRHEKEDEGRHYYMREGRQSYWRHLSLPREARPGELKYSFEHGKLRISMPVSASVEAYESKSNERKEISDDKHQNASEAKRSKTISFRNQEFPNHWTRYRPVR